MITLFVGECFLFYEIILYFSLIIIIIISTPLQPPTAIKIDCKILICSLAKRFPVLIVDSYRDSSAYFSLVICLAEQIFQLLGYFDLLRSNTEICHGQVNEVIAAQTKSLQQMRMCSTLNPFVLCQKEKKKLTK